ERRLPRRKDDPTPPLRAVQPRPLRGQPRRRGLLAGPVRGRGDRDVHRARWGRGSLRVLLRRAVHGSRPRRRRARGHRHPGEGGHAK
ncbi:MAG: 3-aminobutyryl-CoA ammonia-lyase, partial [uncultured Nocardioides sp.]